MMAFDFASPTRIVFGPRKIATLESLILDFVKSNPRIFVVTGKSTARAKALLQSLESSFAWDIFAVPEEPSVELVTQAVSQARDFNTNIVVAIGGGSALDCGKAVAMLLTNEGTPMDYLEVIGSNKPISNASLPMIAIPTTAGTGSEVTRNAVLKSESARVKVSLRALSMIPSVALVDPTLMLTIPPRVTASTGLDALTQVIEPFISRMANPLTDLIAGEGIRLAARSLLVAYKDGNNLPARTDMALASLYGGLALANAKLGAVHGFAGVIGGMYDAPHGMICAALLPYCLESNLSAILRNTTESEIYLPKFDQLARLLTGSPTSKAEDGISFLKHLCTMLEVPRLADIGIKETEFDEIVTKSAISSSMKGNPVDLAPSELLIVLKSAM